MVYMRASTDLLCKVAGRGLVSWIGNIVPTPQNSWRHSWAILIAFKLFDVQNMLLPFQSAHIPACQSTCIITREHASIGLYKESLVEHVDLAANIQSKNHLAHQIILLLICDLTS